MTAGEVTARRQGSDGNACCVAERQTHSWFVVVVVCLWGRGEADSQPPAHCRVALKFRLLLCNETAYPLCV